jgi:hypothetical protein
MWLSSVDEAEKTAVEWRGDLPGKTIGENRCETETVTGDAIGK